LAAKKVVSEENPKNLTRKEIIILLQAWNEGDPYAPASSRNPTFPASFTTGFPHSTTGGSNAGLPVIGLGLSKWREDLMRQRRVGLTLIGVLLLITHNGWAQDRSATINGTVQDGTSIGGVIRDEAGLPLPGTRIIVSDERGERKVSWTNGLGEYSIPNLAGKTVSVRAEKRGFLTSTHNDVALGSPGRILRDFTLVLDTKSQPADALAVRFSRRLAETRDFAVLIPELFSPNFDDYLAAQFKSDDGMVHLTDGTDIHAGLDRIRIDPNLVSRLEPREIRSYFAQSANFTHLAFLRILTSMPVSAFSDEAQRRGPLPIPSFNVLFPEVVPLLREDPVLSMWTNPASDDEVRITTPAQFRRTLATLERADALMRAKVSNPPAERSEQFGTFTNLIEIRQYNEAGLDAKETVCSSCVPAGTKFVRVIYELFALYLVDVKGQLRIGGVDLFFAPAVWQSLQRK